MSSVMCLETEAAMDPHEAPTWRPQPKEDVFLHPGQLMILDEPTTITAVLGSCVAVCLWDPVRGLGGITHFLLPHGRGSESGLRYGDVATEALVMNMLARGSLVENLRARLFGGACVLEPLRIPAHSLGNANVAAAQAVLRRHAIPLVSSDVGGSRGRRLVFHTQSGETEVEAL